MNFKQYIPNKRAHFGIKMFSLCDESGHLWNSEIYTGKNNVSTNSYNISEELVNRVYSSSFTPYEQGPR